MLGSERVRVFHDLAKLRLPAEILEVGSTAVPNVLGKQDIDILVRCSNNHFSSVRNRLSQSYLKNANQLSNDIYQGYIVPSPLDVSIQLTVKDGLYDHFERFLNLLRADEVVREAYNHLKQDCDGLPMSLYRDEKHHFIKRLLF